MKFEWKIRDWKKWLIIAVAALSGAVLQDFIYPQEPMHIATRIGALVGATVPAFALGGIFAIPFKGTAGAVVGVLAVAAVWGLEFLGQSFH